MNVIPLIPRNRAAAHPVEPPKGAPAQPGSTEQWLRSLDVRAPRYTSYPTADRFVEAFAEVDYRRHLQGRQLTHAGPLSLYLHVPFCESLCYYCGCNKVITRRHDKAGPYLRHLAAELGLVLDSLTGPRQLTQMHWGGGTPTFLSLAQIRGIMNTLRQSFDFAPGGEYAIEIDPRTVDEEKLAGLAEAGFNRISLGVQDIDPDVQKAVNRIQPLEMNQQVLAAARRHGFRSTNLDLIYGLPRQTLARFERTIDAILDMRPDRLALYNYAHLPSRFKAQRQILDHELPGPQDKLAIFEMASRRLLAAGYVDIGMDHFALPEDELAVARRAGTLHRNFQGYSTHPDSDLIALGASAISKVGACYAQNERGLREYGDRVERGELPILRGIELTRDDLLRRTIIMALMCQERVSIEAIEIANLVPFRQTFERELKALQPLMDMGLVSLDDTWLSITAPGRVVMRSVCAVFDRYLQSRRDHQTFSRVL